MLDFVVNIFAKKLKKLKTQGLENTNSGKKSYHLEPFMKPIPKKANKVIPRSIYYDTVIQEAKS